jgi:hypothetical protein
MEDSKNIFQIWKENEEALPFKAKRSHWSGDVEQYYIVESIEIKKWPYGDAFGRYFRNGNVGECELIKNSGTYSWELVK